MPTAVQIEVRVDENATNASLGKIGTSIKQLQADVTTATKNLADAQLQLGKAAEQGNTQAKAAIAEYEAALQRAERAVRSFESASVGAISHQVPQYAAASGAVRLLEGNMNNLIRPAERFLATTLGMGPALQAAFPVVGAIAMGSVLLELIHNGKDWLDTLGGMTATMKAFNEENIKASQFAETHFRSPSVGRGLIGSTTRDLSNANAQKVIGGAIQEAGLSNIFSVEGIAQNAAGTLTILDAQDKEAENKKKLIAQHQQMAELEQREHLQTIQFQNEANEANLKGFALLAQKHADEAKLIHQQYSDQKADSDMLNAALKANDDKYAAERIALEKQVHDETVQLQQHAIEAQLTGIQKIIYERDVELQKVLDNDKKMGVSEELIQEQMLAVYEKYQSEIDKQRQQNFDKAAKEYQDHEQHIQQLESDARNASLKGIDLIVAKEQEKIAKLNVIDADYEQQKVLIEQQANAEITKEQQKQVEEQQRQWRQYTSRLGNDLYQAFNEITSGRIGKLIKDGFTRLFANILAQWIATVQGIQSVGVRGGMMGSVLGSILGIGGGGIPGFGSGPYGLPPGVASDFAGSDISASEMAQLSSMNPALSAGSLGPIMGGGSLSTTVAAASTIGGIIAPTPVGGGTTGAGRTSGIGALFSGAGLTKLLPAALLGTLLLGSKGGNSAIAAGGLLAAGGIGALLTNGPLLAAVAPFAGMLGPAAGGLIGFGLGQQYGPTVGAIGGAASGAATAAGVSLALGLSLAPATLGISALIGGLVGLFSGLFGGGPSKHSQADKYINSNVLPLIQQEITNYEGFRTDFATAINDLEQLKTNSYNQMRQQFGKDATNDEWNKLIVPAIATAENRINTDEAERQRRGTLVFGAPQFAEGGIFPGGPMFGGAGMAVLHPMERVMTARATSMYGPELAAMEASAKAGARSAGAVHIGSILIQAGTVDEKWLRNGGALQIAKAIQRARIEGHAV